MTKTLSLPIIYSKPMHTKAITSLRLTKRRNGKHNMEPDTSRARGRAPSDDVRLRERAVRVRQNYGRGFRGIDVKRIIDDLLGRETTTTDEKQRAKAGAKLDAFVRRCRGHVVPRRHFGAQLKVLGTCTAFNWNLKEPPEATSRAEVRSVMGLLQYFRFLQIVLGTHNQLTSKATKWKWGVASWKQAIEAVLQAIFMEPFVYSRKATVIPDASNQGRGFWLVEMARLRIIK